MSAALRKILPLLFAVAVVGVAAPAEAAVKVSFHASPVDLAPVGTIVRWTGSASGGSGSYWYRFRVRPSGGTLRVIRDFGPSATLEWTSLDQGFLEMELTVQDRVSSETATATLSYRFLTRVFFAPVVSPTSNPLVFLFSSAGCSEGRARVRVESAGRIQSTPSRPCISGLSLNFYLAGLAPNTSYTANLVVEQMRSESVGPAVTFRTGAAAFEVPFEIVQAAPALQEGFLLQAPLFIPPFATDLQGNIVWTGPPGLSYMTHPGADGTFFAVAVSPTDPAENVLRRFDLTGMTVQETNAARVSEQLVSMGRRPITGFHHDARSISGGRTAVLASVEELLTDVQGDGPVDVLGDMIVILDADFQVVWSWDAFDHLDVSRKAILGEKCRTSPGCAPYTLAADANDWTHSNSVAETPDGDLLLSIRHQDWVVKIDYARGAGDGHLIWRLGKDGDFAYDSTDPYPWFSHQHDVEYESANASTISVFDNGNTRAVMGLGLHSRGQVIELDEPNRIARLAMNADLGLLSIALGSAQKLGDGHYHFDAGFQAAPAATYGGVGYALEVAPPGDIVSSLMFPVPIYRSFRVRDLYGPAGAPDQPGTRSVAFRQ